MSFKALIPTRLGTPMVICDFDTLVFLLAPRMTHIFTEIPVEYLKTQSTDLLHVEWGTEEIQFMPELWRFEREKGGWNPPPPKKKQ